MIAPDIDTAFADFDAANPHVWTAFQALVERAIRAGRSRYSADAIVHLIRWQANVETRREDEFKINNSFVSRYARKWIEANPARASFFETRVLRSRAPEPGAFGRGAAE